MAANQSINTLLVGWNVEAATLFDRILSAPALGYNVRGFIRPAGKIEGVHYKNVALLGGLNEFADVLNNYNIQQVIIVLSSQERQYLQKIIDICIEKDISYRVVAESAGVEYEHVIRNVIRDIIHPSEFGVRRLIDFGVALTLMILLFPLFIVTAFAIKIESHGSIFYSQERYGKNRTLFKVIKFRSMVQDAEKKSGPVWATKSDARVTKVGAFMRKTRIDELPQLMNILKGEMSFIGPRPERPFFADEFKKQIPFYMNRLKVLPGITGLAQVTVGYDETIEDVRNKVLADLEYIEYYDSFKMNFGILFKTVQSVVRGEGQ